MNQSRDLTPAALYARVSSDRQDVDPSVAAQLRALRTHAASNGYLVAREYIDEAESGRVDEFYSENLAQEVTRGMREAASRGFWVSSNAPYGYRKAYVQDGAQQGPRLELNPPHDATSRRMFDMALRGKSNPRHRQDSQR